MGETQENKQLGESSQQNKPTRALCEALLEQLMSSQSSASTGNKSRGPGEQERAQLSSWKAGGSSRDLFP